MSVRMISEVWRLKLRGSRLLVALCLADFADDNGSNVYPSVGLVAWKCGLSPRQVQYVYRDLKQIRFLRYVDAPLGQRRTYAIDPTAVPRKAPHKPTPAKFAGVPSTAGAECKPPHAGCETHFREGMKPASSNPSSNRQDEPSVESSSGDDYFFSKLFAEVRSTYPWAAEEHVRFALDRIRSRAKSPPGSVRYWRKSLSQFFENWDAEVRAYEKEEAMRRELRVGRGPEVRPKL